MTIKDFLELKKRDGGLHTFQNHLIRFYTNINYPKYSVFNLVTRKAILFDDIKELLNYEIDGKKIKEYIFNYKHEILILDGKW